MLLTIDVGNTKTVVGLFEGTALLDSWYFDTVRTFTAPDAAAQLAHLMEQAYDARTAPHGETPDAGVVASVVTGLAEVWTDGIAQAFGAESIVCTGSAAKALGLFDTSVDNIGELGADLVADAIAARAVFGSPVVVVDFGTATTVEFLDGEGCLGGVSIAPGAESSIRALFKEASAINTVPVAAPAHVLGKNTAESVQSGIVFGEAARADGLVDRGLAELGYTEAQMAQVPVVATGGLCDVISEHSFRITAVDKFLTLKGLMMMDAAVKAKAAAEVAAAEAAAAEAARAEAAEREARLRHFRDGSYSIKKVQGLKGSPFA